MIGDRVIQIRMVKDAPLAKGEPNRSFDPESLVRTIAKASILVVTTYMGTDALRKIVVHVVATKIN